MGCNPRGSMLVCIALLIVLAAGLGACQGDAPELPDVSALYDTYGAAAVSAQDAVPVEAVLAEPAPYLRRTVKVAGTVTEVCQTKGCWLTLDGGADGDVRIFVAKTDSGEYRFTVPKDISGRHVVVEGWLEAKTLDVETQRHLAEEGGEAAPEDIQPRRELQLTADAVLVQKTAS